MGENRRESRSHEVRTYRESSVRRTFALNEGFAVTSQSKPATKINRAMPSQKQEAFRVVPWLHANMVNLA